MPYQSKQCLRVSILLIWIAAALADTVLRIQLSYQTDDYLVSKLYGSPTHRGLQLHTCSCLLQVTLLLLLVQHMLVQPLCHSVNTLKYYDVAVLCHTWDWHTSPAISAGGGHRQCQPVGAIQQLQQPGMHTTCTVHTCCLQDKQGEYEVYTSCMCFISGHQMNHMMSLAHDH
jgi:hypothetical protein